MEEELNYVSVNFIRRDAPTQEKQQELDQVYDEVKTESQRCDAQQAITEQDYKQSIYLLLVVCLGIICVILVSVLTVLSIQFQTMMSAQHTLNDNLTEQNRLLLAEKMHLQNRTGELTTERDRLNWTMGVILEFSYFPVLPHCPQKVCQSCREGWKLFQSKCYLFVDSNWNHWSDSQKYCQGFNADLVVIDSDEEQEFINNIIKMDHDDRYGYWIGLTRQTVRSRWTWVDGSNTTVTYWIKENSTPEKCALLLPKSPRQANWKMTYCGNYYNFWICEMKSLIMPEDRARAP